MKYCLIGFFMARVFPSLGIAEREYDPSSGENIDWLCQAIWRRYEKVQEKLT